MKITDMAKLLRQRRQREIVYSEPDYWNSKAADYEADAVSMWPNNHLNAFYHREQVSVLETHFPDVCGISVLDIGCGTGRMSRYLVARGAIVTGIDFAAEPIAIAKRLSTQCNPTYRRQSVFDLDDIMTYDAAIAWACLTMACRNDTELLDVMRRVKGALRPGGKLLIVEPIHRGFLHRVLDMDIRDFCAVMAEAGFEVKEVSHLAFWPMRLLLAYIQWPKAITAAGYNIGNGILKCLGRKAMGDYKAIYAQAAEQP